MYYSTQATNEPFYHVYNDTLKFLTRNIIEFLRQASLMRKRSMLQTFATPKNYLTPEPTFALATLQIRHLKTINLH